MKIRSVVKGAMSFIPGANKLLPKPIAGNHPGTAYYYGVWMKHLALLANGGMRRVPQTVAELGPGDTLGVGIAALLCGATTFYGLDIFAHTNPTENLKVLDELAAMFRARAPRPTKGWPDFDELLDANLFPSGILTPDTLAASLDPARQAAIADILRGAPRERSPVTLAYRVPWNDGGVIERDSVDLLLSQAVLEHVAELEKTYRAMHQWLRPGGYISHQIDFRSHNLTPEWNGHRSIPDWLWTIMVGRRDYLINREPWSVHKRLIEDSGFEITCVLQQYRQDGIPRSRLAARWRDITDDDLACSEVFVQARKR